MATFPFDKICPHKWFETSWNIVEGWPDVVGSAMLGLMWPPTDSWMAWGGRGESFFFGGAASNYSENKQPGINCGRRWSITSLQFRLVISSWKVLLMAMSDKDSQKAFVQTWVFLKLFFHHQNCWNLWWNVSEQDWVFYWLACNWHLVFLLVQKSPHPPLPYRQLPPALWLTCPLNFFQNQNQNL